MEHECEEENGLVLSLNVQILYSCTEQHHLYSIFD